MRQACGALAFEAKRDWPKANYNQVSSSWVVWLGEEAY